MNAQHTPGPWRAEEWRCHAKTTVLVDDPMAFTGKSVIAECETEADARAIAALPDLLDAAQKALILIQLCVDGDMEPSDEADALRAAIAKATGA